MRLVCVEYAHKQLNIAEVDAGKNFPTDCNHVRDFLNALPTIDAVPVVRCKDCKHGSLFSVKKRLVDCPYYDDQLVDFDHYCSYGERKDGE